MRYAAKETPKERRFSLRSLFLTFVKVQTRLSHLQKEERPREIGSFTRQLWLCGAAMYLASCTGNIETSSTALMQFNLSASSDRLLYLIDCFHPRVPRSHCISMPNSKDCDALTLTVKKDGEVCSSCQKGSVPASNQCARPPEDIDIKAIQQASSTAEAKVTLVASNYRPLQFDSCVKTKGQQKCSTIPNPQDLQRLVIEVSAQGKIRASGWKGQQKVPVEQELPVQCRSTEQGKCIQCSAPFNEILYDSCNRTAQDNGGCGGYGGYPYYGRSGGGGWRSYGGGPYGGSYNISGFPIYISSGGGSGGAFVNPGGSSMGAQPVPGNGQAAPSGNGQAAPSGNGQAAPSGNGQAAPSGNGQAASGNWTINGPNGPINGTWSAPQGANGPISISGVPGNITNNGNGSYTFTPNGNANGMASGPITISGLPGNLTNNGNGNYTFTPNGNGMPSGPITVSGLPGNVANNGNGSISFTPNGSSSGPITVSGIPGNITNNGNGSVTWSPPPSGQGNGGSQGAQSTTSAPQGGTSWSWSSSSLPSGVNPFSGNVTSLTNNLLQSSGVSDSTGAAFSSAGQTPLFYNYENAMAAPFSYSAPSLNTSALANSIYLLNQWSN
jgi:hypothetical protein